jgi:DNA-binding beta-propeller fold protein YncE
MSRCRCERTWAVALWFCALLTAVPSAQVQAADGIQLFSVPGRPFAVAVSADGSTVFVSTVGAAGAQSGIHVFHRAGAELTAGGFVPLDGDAYGITLTPDGATLLVANGLGIAALDAQALARSGKADPVYARTGPDAGTIEVVAARDGMHAFVTEERRAAVAVVRVERGKDGALDLSIVGTVPTDRAPVGLALTADGARLYVASEVAAKGRALANAGVPEVVRARCQESGAANGTLAVIDALKAVTDPANAVVATFAAGCAPVRVALSPRDDVAWVTARGDDRLLAFDTAKMHDDPAHALVANVGVGPSPVGVAIVQDGALAVVANSDRFSGMLASSTIDVVDTARAIAHQDAVVKSLPAGTFPREFAEAPDHRTLYLTNFRSGTLEIIGETALR